MTDESVPQQDNQPEKRCSKWARLGLSISTLAVVVFICGFGYGYFELSKVNVQLAQLVTDLQKQVTNGQSDITGMQQSVNALQQSMQKSQELSSQQEKLMSEWRAAQQGDMNKWHAAEAQYLTKMADVQLQYSHNTKMAVTLLQSADKELQNTQDPGLLDVRKSLTSDLTNLQALPQVDVTTLFLRLNALNDLVDKLPLPASPLKADNQAPAASSSSQTSWWKTGLDSAWQGLNKIVIIRKNGSSALPLVLPDEKIFLYQNLHAQLENVAWGLLHDNAEVYSSGLTRAIAWIQHYFDQDAQETKTMLQQLSELQKMNIHPEVISLANTLQLFDSYLANVKAGQ